MAGSDGSSDSSAFTAGFGRGRLDDIVDRLDRLDVEQGR